MTAGDFIEIGEPSNVEIAIDRPTNHLRFVVRNTVDTLSGWRGTKSILQQLWEVESIPSRSVISEWRDVPLIVEAK